VYISTLLIFTCQVHILNEAVSSVPVSQRSTAKGTRTLQPTHGKISNWKKEDIYHLTWVVILSDKYKTMKKEP